MALEEQIRILEEKIKTLEGGNSSGLEGRIKDSGGRFVDSRKTSLIKQHKFAYMWTTQWIDYEIDGLYLGKIPRIIKVPTNTPVYGGEKGDAILHYEKYYGYVKEGQWPQEVKNFHKEVLKADKEGRLLKKEEVEKLAGFYKRHIEAKRRGDHKGNSLNDAGRRDNTQSISGESGQAAVGASLKRQNGGKAKPAAR